VHADEQQALLRNASRTYQVRETSASVGCVSAFPIHRFYRNRNSFHIRNSWIGLLLMATDRDFDILWRKFKAIDDIARGASEPYSQDVDHISAIARSGLTFLQRMDRGSPKPPEPVDPPSPAPPPARK
jgi:hypothetical protein